MVIAIIPVGSAPVYSTPDARQDPMADKVLAIVRETMLHENTLESFSFRPAIGEVLLALLQPDDRFQYPEHELLLTYTGLKSFSVEGGEESGGKEVLRIECKGCDRRVRSQDLPGRLEAAAMGDPPAL